MNDAIEGLTVEAIERIESAVIDTSSLIFAHKAGFLKALTKAVRLTTPPGVLKELKGEITPTCGLDRVDTMPESEELYNGYAVDVQVVVTALDRKQPVISDDYRLLERAGSQGLEGYTVRTMLELALLRGEIDLKAYTSSKRALAGLIRYALPIFLAAEELHWEIRKRIG